MAAAGLEIFNFTTPGERLFMTDLTTSSQMELVFKSVVDEKKKE